MGQLADFSLDQMAGACALVLGSLGGLMLVLFKSNCLKIKCCFGLVQCTRRPPSIDESTVIALRVAKPCCGSVGRKYGSKITLLSVK